MPLDSNFGIFWDEYRVIEQSTHRTVHVDDAEDGVAKKEDKNESKIQWLNDVGFTNVANKFQAKTEIDPNDEDMKFIVASLTRAQASAVRRRIDSLNEAIRQRKMNEENPMPSQINPYKRKDVRDVFPTLAISPLAAGSLHKHTTKSERYISIPTNNHDTKCSGKDIPASNHDAKSSGKDTSFLLPQHSSPPIVSAKPKVRSIPTASKPYSQENASVDKVNKRRSSSPKGDNLVRCTSVKNLVFQSGEDLERKDKRPNSMLFINNADIMSLESSKLIQGKPGRKTANVERRKTISNDELLEKTASVFKSEQLYKDRDVKLKTSTPSLLSVDDSSKKLVRIDSKYIKVSNVEDNYINTNHAKPCPDQQTNHQKNSDRSPIHLSYEETKQTPENVSFSVVPSKPTNTKNVQNILGNTPSHRDQHVQQPYETIYDDTLSSVSSIDRKLNLPLTNTGIGIGLEGDAKLDVGAGSPREEKSLAQQDSGHSFPSLPNFTLNQEELGMTRVGDLSTADMTKVRSLALIELTALFDSYGISMNRRKAPTKQKCKEQGVFGVPLTTLSQKDKLSNNSAAPDVFKKMICYIEKNGLEEEGILRIPGSTTRTKKIKEILEREFDSFLWEGLKISDVCTCLKQFLRDLPIPLLSYEYQNTFASVADLKDRKVQLQALNLLVLLLHPIHQETLKLLLAFLQKVIYYEHSNKMGLNNVAMIMAPNLFFNNTKINMQEAQKAAAMTDVLRMLIKYQQILWIIPAFMVGQIRYLYEAGANAKDPKAVKKIIARRLKNEVTSSVVMGGRGKSSGSSGDELDDSDDNFIIRVKAPNFNKQSMAIQLRTSTTAADIIDKFQWRRQNSMKANDHVDSRKSRPGQKKTRKPSLKSVQFCLCEAGGNIGERILEPASNIYAILKVNPNAEWLLKVVPPRC